MPAAFESVAEKLTRWPRDARQALSFALALWVIPMVVIGTMVAINPTKRTLTPLYHEAAANWWAGQSLYSGPQGMNYLPHFAVLFTPFHALPLPVADVLWRLCAAAMLASGLWQIMRALYREGPERPFLWATLVAMPLCMNALRNGQANAAFGGVTLLATAAVLNQRWWLAAVLMTLATAIKPLGIVLLLLAPAFYGPLRGRVLVMMGVMAIFPFLFAKPDYVMSQYREMFTNLQACAVVTENRFADINGILRTFGTAFSPMISKLLRVMAGGLTLGLWWWGAKRLSRPVACLWLYALAASYLMLFNPMNEENSYVILAPALGAWGVFFLFDVNAGPQRWFGWGILGMTLSMALLPNILRPIFHNHFALFWHPLMTLVFLAMLIQFVSHERPVSEDRVNIPDLAEGKIANLQIR